MKNMPDDRLENLRERIDALDGELIDLLARRRDLVEEVAERKIDLGLPVYVPEREEAMFRSRRAEAEGRGVAPNLVEDLLRRIMRESYSAEGARGFRCAVDDPRPVVLVGGRGQMGRLLDRALTASGYEVRILEREDWDNATTICEGAGLVLIGVPIAATVDVIKACRGIVPPDAVMADITSLKAGPVQTMCEVHPGPVVGLHPMFGPSVGSFAKQVVVRCHGRDAGGYAWLLDQIRIWGAAVVDSDAEVHDRLMGTVQALCHFTTFVYGSHLMDEDVDLAQVLAMSSPIYRLELGMVGRLFAQDPDLYTDIIFNSAEGPGLAHRYRDRFDAALTLYESGDRDAFRERFCEVSDWFGPLAETFLAESSSLLDQARDRMNAGVSPGADRKA